MPNRIETFFQHLEKSHDRVILQTYGWNWKIEINIASPLIL